MNKPELLARTKHFALSVVRFHAGLPRRTESWVLGKQLLRSGTSIGANYREAQRARSKSEFISKVHIAMQEAEETAYWLELLIEAALCDKGSGELLLRESNELCAVLTAIAASAQRSANKP